MANKKETPPQQEKARSANQPEYTRAELLGGGSSLFGVKSEVVAGALFGSAKETYSIEEMARLIRQFQQRKVQR